MNCHPILFSGEMVRAILAGRKTQTRRVIEYQPTMPYLWNKVSPNGMQLWTSNPLQGEKGETELRRCPYGAGDTLWVRETFWEWGGTEKRVGYRADMPETFAPNGGYKPSIFMPRWASRISLEVRCVRAERLQEIAGNPSDLRSEGIEKRIDGTLAEMQQDFTNLWDSINAKRGHSWQSNPWVWVIEFWVVVA